MECLTPICESLLKKAKDEVGIVFGKSQALLNKEDAERVLFQKVIELSTNYLPNLYFVRQCFDDHHFYRKAIHYASEVFFTVDISRSSVVELLTRMCDDILKKGNLTRITSSNLMDREDEIFTDEERQTIDKVVMVVSLLSDIDDFIEFYSRELARRLLKKKNGDSREIYVLEMITEQYGVQATYKMRHILSFSEIQTELNVADMDLIKILHSLSCAEYNILTKEQNSKTISRMDFFKFNSKFTHTRTELKIPLLLTEEERWDEKTRIFEVINQNKTSEIDAMIIKVMKNHKVLTHQQLAKCIIELRKTFQPDEETIKKRIESLIEQQYMRRDELNDGEYCMQGRNFGNTGINQMYIIGSDVIDKSFGFDTAVEEAQRAINVAHVEVENFENGVGIVKLMGRYSSFIAMYATLASRDVDCCLIPESPFYLEGSGGLFEFIEQRLKEKGHMVIVLAEGAGQEHVAERMDVVGVKNASGNKLLLDACWPMDLRGN
ncbi:hypothetical protein GIB67_023846 [Kingdonia uniflora]|uniref:Cullin family profile domain-containing protein n=1 Tax=Kingdonia uniflora TaxID=39325 RepID=A0A7J7NG22_9MAGN|nr:hypothetical protein GIB67_023846 [Kingdonia uniflora]